MGFKKILFFLVFSFGFSGHAFAEKWYEIKSENFVLYTDNRESAGLKFVEDLEFFRHFLQGLTNVQNTQATLPLEIFAYKGRATFTKEMGVADNIGGFFRTHFKGTSAFGMTPRQNEGGGGREILFHEYVHYFTSQFSRFHYPIWYREGFADYLSAFTFSKGTITVGQDPPGRAYILDTEKWFHLRYLLESMSNWSVDTEPENALGLVYAQSWLLVHYLNTKPEYKRNMVNYLIEIDKGENFEEAFGRTFSKTINDMDIELNAYWKKRKIPYTYYKLSDVDFKPKVSSRKLSSGEASYFKAKARTYRIFDKEGLEKFEEYTKKILKKNPEAYKIKLLLAEQMDLWGSEEKEAEAAKIINQISLENPEDSDAQTLQGRVLFYQSFETENEEEKKELVNQARIFFKRAIKLNPRNVYALYHLGYSYIYYKSDKPGPGFNAMIKAIDLVPQQNLFQFNLGLLQARYGYLEEARETFEYYLEFGYRKRYRGAALFCLDEFELAGEEHQCLFTDYRDLNKFGPEG